MAREKPREQHLERYDGPAFVRQIELANDAVSVGWQDLKDLFRSAGNVQRANIMQGRDGRSKGHGIVLYATVADAQKAISTFDGYEWHGRKLEVREDRSAMDFPPPPPRTENANAMIQCDAIRNEAENDLSNTSASTTSNDMNGTTSSTQTAPSPVDYPISTNENLDLSGITLNGTKYVDESTASNSTVGNGANGINGTASSNLQRQLFVGNLPFRVRWQDLKDLFRKAGTVLRADVAMGYDNRSKGHGTVLFGSSEDAKKAIVMFNNYNWLGRIIEVREDRGGFSETNGASENSGNNVGNNNYMQENVRRTVEHVMNHSPHPQPPYAPSAPIIGPAGIYFPTRGIQAPQHNFSGRLLFVGNLPFNCQWQDLKDLFRNAGNIIRADVSTSYDGRSRGFGTVLFATPEDARRAVELYNGYEFQGRTLRVHFDKYSLPPMPHPHNPPHHPVHLAPAVHPHHRPPLITNIHHNFHLGHPPPIHPHFMPPTHIGPFSPPLATPPLTSPPPFPTTYNPLAHHGSQHNSTVNGSAPFQPMQIVSATAGSVQHNVVVTSTNSSQNVSQDQQQTAPATQFSGFGPIGKTHHSPQSTTTTSSISNLGSVGYSGASNSTNGIVGTSVNGSSENNNYGAGNNDNTLHSLASSFTNLHIGPTPQQLFFHPPHPHHRPPIPTAGLVNMGGHYQAHISSASASFNHTAFGVTNGLVRPPSSSANNVAVVVEAENNGGKSNILGSSSTNSADVSNSSSNTNGTSSSVAVPSSGLWDSSANSSSNGTSSVMSIGMTTSLTGMNGLDGGGASMVPTMMKNGYWNIMEIGWFMDDGVKDIMCENCGCFFGRAIVGLNNLWDCDGGCFYLVSGE
ncbi:1378_t:CDS:10 [Acaulospora morrowiae]|uniref:1378_t:CDS:1 n=1 Tax=Acaulospora morrowiae TaxID=94023 RepID=A0A9N9FYM0_9GLOM|nr:1378_t:CDS:10 [Acaulospora morrowiae]